MVGIRIIRQQLATVMGDKKHVLVLHAEAVSRFITKRFETKHHAFFNNCVAACLAKNRGRAQVGVFMQVQANTVSNERNRRQVELGELADEGIVNFATARPWLDHVHDLILALDKVSPDFFCFRWGSLYNSSATHAGLIAVNDREDLHTTDITPFKHFFGDRKSTRLNSSHVRISYAVFCLKKKKKNKLNRNIKKTKNILIYKSSKILAPEIIEACMTQLATVGSSLRPGMPRDIVCTLYMTV